MAPSHGGLNYEKLLKQGIGPKEVKDFSVSINPAPLPNSVKQAISQAPLDRYPDSDSRELRRELSRIHNLPSDHFFVTNGTSQAVYLLSQAFLNSSSTWAISAPTYSEYADACSLQSPHRLEFHTGEKELFYPVIESIIQGIEEKQPKILWLCSPNNPTGIQIEEEDFHRIRQCCINNNCIFIIDEAYRCFIPEDQQYDTFLPGVINLRSMTKDYSIPGLRLGYFRAEPELIERVRPYRPEWSVSQPAQYAGCSALKEQKYFQSTWRKTIDLTGEFRRSVEEAGYKTYPTTGNFFLVKVHRLEELKEYLWKDLITLRDCTSFGMTDIVRLGTGKSEENKQLVEALKVFKELFPPLS
ncbi:MAG: histidinol-phosphate transaminase [Spirochaetaceae bacterium]|jgi:histidinol-phosphate/aromatic aminotransferase/cobyric acid decarboxylase-like protein|nr:histidinol-phosphate transaminase [Spirochaetaceae bacterium]